MPTSLIIDTSAARCCVALQYGDLLRERVSGAERQSAQRVLPMISELLAEAAIQLSDVDLIGVVAGPGSFTGVRIGVAVAQGLSLSAGIQAVALSSLALQAYATSTHRDCVHVLVSEEARDGELYFAAYQSSPLRGVELIGREQVAKIEELDALPEALSSATWCLAGNGWLRQDEILRHLACKAAEKPISTPIECQHIANLAQLRFQCGEAVAASQLQPNYVKEQLDYT
jgi:tRNA threonylcarbamoyladenosine biosynthesis protein TsaB